MHEIRITRHYLHYASFNFKPLNIEWLGLVSGGTFHLPTREGASMDFSYLYKCINVNVSVLIQDFLYWQRGSYLIFIFIWICWVFGSLNPPPPLSWFGTTGISVCIWSRASLRRGCKLMQFHVLSLEWKLKRGVWCLPWTHYLSVIFTSSKTNAHVWYEVLRHTTVETQLLSTETPKSTKIKVPCRSCFLSWLLFSL